MSDPLTTRAARDWREERDGAERRRPAVPPAPGGEEDYGACAPSAPLIDIAPSVEQSDIVELRVVSAASFAGVAPPERRWVVKDMIPDRTVTILSGDGGGGKTTLKLQLATAIAGARPWLGHSPDPGRVLVVTAEDDEDEIHRRIAAIAKSLDVDLSDLGDLHIVPLAGQDAVMGAPEGKAALIAPTAVFRGLVALVERIRPRLVVLDALADVYGGEENARAQARQFITLLRGLAIKNDLAVVLIAHPSLSGMAIGKRDKRVDGLEQFRSRAPLSRTIRRREQSRDRSGPPRPPGKKIKLRTRRSGVAPPMAKRRICAGRPIRRLRQAGRPSQGRASLPDAARAPKRPKPGSLAEPEQEFRADRLRRPP